MKGYKLDLSGQSTLPLGLVYSQQPAVCVPAFTDTRLFQHSPPVGEAGGRRCCPSEGLCPYCKGSRVKTATALCPPSADTAEPPMCAEQEHRQKGQGGQLGNPSCM